jgi:hypothetical protein
MASSNYNKTTTIFEERIWASHKEWYSAKKKKKDEENISISK